MKRSIVLFLIAVFLVACSRDPNVRKQKYMASGRSYYEAGKYKEAAVQFSNALLIDGRNAEGHHELAKTFLKLQSWNNAYRELMRTVDLRPDNLTAQLELGNLFLGGREFSRAQERAELVLHKEPNNPHAHALLANAFAAQNEKAKAVAEIQKAIEISPGEATLWVNLGLFQTAMNRPEEAEKSLRKALELDPSSLTPVQALAKFYELQQNWTEAEKMLRRASAVAPKEVGPRLELARVYLVQNRPDQAEQVVREAKAALADSPEGYRLLADFYLGRGELDKALDEVRRLHDEHPKDANVTKTYVRLLIVRGQLGEAAKLNDELLKSNPKDRDGKVLRAEILTRSGNPAQAVDLLQEAVKADAANADFHYFLGNALSASGKLEQARAEWQATVRLRPDYVLAHQRLASTAEATGNLEQLSVSANQLIAAAPTLPDGYLFRAVAELARKQYPQGEADLKKAATLAPRDPVPLARLGQLRLLQNKDAEGEKLLRQSLEMAPAMDAVQPLLGLYQKQKDPAKALALLDAQLARAPNNSNFHYFKGLVLADTKRVEEAAQEIQRAVDLDSSNIAALHSLASLQVQEGHAEKAVATYEEGLKRNPGDMRVTMLLATMYDQTGNWQKAEEGYKKVLVAQPDNPLAANNLAYAMLERGENADVALTLAQKARQGLPEAPTTADTLAWAYYRKGAYRSAVDLLEEAVRKAPDNANFQYHLGMTYKELNDRTNAKAHLERSLQLNPKSAHAEDIRKTLAQLHG